MTNKLLQLYAGIRYYIFSKHRRGYGIHSPFMYDLIRNVMMKASGNKCSNLVSSEFKRFVDSFSYKKSNTEFGAGSRQVNSSQNIIQLAKTSGLKGKYLNLICELVSYYKLNSFLELGTCCGITSATLAKSNPELEITTIEGNEERYHIANQLFEKLEISNVNAICGDFRSELKRFSDDNLKFDLIFIDGDHTYSATVENYQKAIHLCSDQGIVIIDDIYWSGGMTKAWREIISDERAIVTVDLFRMGIVFLGRKQVKQSFTIRF
jgi:predicted O-methyltransferase YrrM